MGGGQVFKGGSSPGSEDGPPPFSPVTDRPAPFSPVHNQEDRCHQRPLCGLPSLRGTFHCQVRVWACEMGRRAGRRITAGALTALGREHRELGMEPRRSSNQQCWLEKAGLLGEACCGRLVMSALACVGAFACLHHWDVSWVPWPVPCAFCHELLPAAPGRWVGSCEPLPLLEKGR